MNDFARGYAAALENILVITEEYQRTIDNVEPSSLFNYAPQIIRNMAEFAKNGIKRASTDDIKERPQVFLYEAFKGTKQ